MRNSKDQTWRLATIWYGNIYHDVYSVLTSQRVLDFVHWIEFIIFCKDDQTILKYCICAYNYFFGSMVLIHHNSTCFVDGWQVFTCLALPGRISIMIACVTQLRIRLSLPRVLDGPESLFLLACFLWRCSIQEQDSFKMEILKGRSSSSPRGPTNKQTEAQKSDESWWANETGWMETDIKHPVFRAALPPQTSKHRNWEVHIWTPKNHLP